MKDQRDQRKSTRATLCNLVVNAGNIVSMLVLRQEGEWEGGEREGGIHLRSWAVKCAENLTSYGCKRFPS
jgi:hypothetical protein